MVLEKGEGLGWGDGRVGWYWREGVGRGEGVGMCERMRMMFLEEKGGKWVWDWSFVDVLPYEACGSWRGGRWFRWFGGFVVARGL